MTIEKGQNMSERETSRSLLTRQMRIKQEEASVDDPAQHAKAYSACKDKKKKGNNRRHSDT